MVSVLPATESCAGFRDKSRATNHFRTRAVRTRRRKTGYGNDRCLRAAKRGGGETKLRETPMLITVLAAEALSGWLSLRASVMLASILTVTQLVALPGESPTLRSREDGFSGLTDPWAHGRRPSTPFQLQ